MAPPRRCIFNDADLQEFLNSPAKNELVKFTQGMGHSVATSGVEYSPHHPLMGLSLGLAALVGALEEMQAWLSEIPPSLGGDIRFGNPSFKTWHKRLCQRAPGMVQCILQHSPQESQEKEYALEDLESCRQAGKQAAAAEITLTPTEHNDAAIMEVCAYLQDAFGHPIRLDYGTGHESSFQIFLLVLMKLRVFGNSSSCAPCPSRLASACLSCWHAYVAICRGLVREYRLEPAGSHGVWGLDDYYCLVFYFGANQCVSLDDDAKPSDIHNPVLLKQSQSSNLYYSAIAFIQELKSKAPFFETSPMLNDISQLPSWSKVASGLLKYWQGEVLSKRPVVQGWVFGDVLWKASWTPSPTSGEAPTALFRGDLPETRAPWAK